MASSSTSSASTTSPTLPTPLASRPYKHIKVRQLSRNVGGLVEAIDLRRLLADFSPEAKETRAELRQAWLDHGVLFFRNQELTNEEYLQLARVFNEPIEYPFVRGISTQFPQIIEVKKLAHETRAFGNIWHSDTSYLDEPPSATLLLAREIPPFGLGDTIFASQGAAYDALSPKLQQMLQQLVGVNASAKADVSKTREDRIAEQSSDGTPAPPKKDYLGYHPAIRTHPETGRKVLFVNIAHTAYFDGMSEEESAPLLNYLFQHQIKAEFSYRWSWEVGSIAVWDNRQVQHYPVNDYHGYRRLMHRITTKGDRPRL